MRVALLAVLVCCAPDVGEVAPPIDAGEPVVFSHDIRPIFDQRCKSCHYSSESVHPGTDASGLDLSTLAALRRGGDNTHQSIVVPYAPEGSAIVLKLRGTFPVGARCPQDGQPFLSDEQIDLVATWIAQGAKGEDSE